MKLCNCKNIGVVVNVLTCIVRRRCTVALILAFHPPSPCAQCPLWSISPPKHVHHNCERVKMFGVVVYYWLKWLSIPFLIHPINRRGEEGFLFVQSKVHSMRLTQERSETETRYWITGRCRRYWITGRCRRNALLHCFSLMYSWQFNDS